MTDKVLKRKVKCNDCGREFMSAQPENKLRCTCGSLNVSVIPPDEQEPRKEEAPKEEMPKPMPLEIGRSKITREIKLPKIIDLSPKTLSMVDRLVNERGMFPDMKDCVNRAIEMMVTQIENPKYIDYIMKGGNVKMQEEEPNPEKILKTMQVNDLIEAQIDKKKAEARSVAEKIPKGEATKSDLLNALKEQFEIKQLKSMMDNLDGGSGGGSFKDLKEMLTMKFMMDMMTGGGHQPHAGNGESLQLQKKVDDLERQILTQRLIEQVSSKMGKGGNTEDYLKIFADKWEAVEKQKIETEKARHEAVKEREERIESERNHQLDQVQGNIQELEKKLEKEKERGSGIGKLSELKGQIKDLKEFAKEFGEPQPRDKTTGEIAADLILGVAEKLKEPISHAARGFADKQANERMRMQNPEMRPSAPVFMNAEQNQEMPESPIVYTNNPEAIKEVNPGIDMDIVNTFAAQNTNKK